jgi:predicted regulator of amino acid metabolism with ACT domain
MVDFRCREYSDGKTVADQELRQQIIEIGIRKTARATKTDSKTVMLITRGEVRAEKLGFRMFSMRVKPNTLAKLAEFLGKRLASIAIPVNSGADGIASVC